MYVYIVCKEGITHKIEKNLFLSQGTFHALGNPKFMSSKFLSLVTLTLFAFHKRMDGPISIKLFAAKRILAK